MPPASADCQSYQAKPKTCNQNPEIQTQSHRVHAFSSFDLTFDLHRQSQKLKLSLEPNHDILHEDAHVEYLDANGNIRHAERILRHEHKVFQGDAFTIDSSGHWNYVGWARIVVRRDGLDPLFEGAFTIFGDHHHIQLASNYRQTKHILDPELEEAEDEYMTVYRDSDISQSKLRQDLKRDVGQVCSSDNLSFNTNPEHPIFKQSLKRSLGFWGSMPTTSLFGKRQIDNSGSYGGNSGNVNLKASIGSTQGCPSTRKVALIGVATDCTYTGSFNSTDTMRQNVITQVNSASNLYQDTFNITLGLRNLTVSDASCPGQAPQSAPWNVPCGSPTITDRLNLFSTWRGSREDNNAYWSLFSTCNTGAEVGLAWLGQLCTSGTTNGSTNAGNSQTVTGANVIVRTSNEWQVFAHESGHTFGAVHDCDSQTCADSQIMVKIVIVEARKDVGITPAVIQQLANSSQEPSATIVTRDAAEAASLRLLEQSAEQALGLVTHRKHVLEQMQLVQPTKRLQTVKVVVVADKVFIGNCKGASFGGEVKSWIDDNKPLVIGLACGIGGLFLLALLGCLLRRCRAPPKKRRRRHHRTPRPTEGWNTNPGWDGPMPPPMSQRSPGWESQSFGGWQPPQHPPPTYGGGQQVRYA
ncbi:MAG: hypothetical protein Q9227_002581 [Pyrenula ochraceoflavens]